MVQQQGGGSHPSESARPVDITLEPVDMFPEPAGTTPQPGASPPDPLNTGRLDAGPVDGGPVDAGAAGAGPVNAGQINAGSVIGGSDLSPGQTGGGRDAAADRDGDGVEPAPGRRTATRRVMLGSLVVAGVIAAGVLGVAGLRIMSQKDATLAVPDRVGGFTRDDSGQAADAADYLRTALAADIDLDQTVGAVYSDPADADRSILFFGGTALLFTPERELDGMFDMLGDETGSVTGVQEVPAGDLGGVMKCGSVTAPEGNMAVCGWADHGSVAVAMFPGRIIHESAPLMRDLRDRIQTRG